MDKKLIPLLAGVVFALSASMAKATFITGSGSIGTADLIAVQANPLGLNLASPALVLTTGDHPAPFGSGIPVVGWTEDYNDGLLAIVTGPLTADLFAGTIMEGTLGDIHGYSLVGFNGSTLVHQSGGATGGANFIPTFSPTRAELDAILASVPEPTTLALVGLGLAGLGFARRKEN